MITVVVAMGAKDPERLRDFYAVVLDRETADADGPALVPEDDLANWIRFWPLADEKTMPNRVHFDLTSDSPDDQQAIVHRALSAGGRRIDIGQGPDARHVVMADPEGNEFDVLESGNRFTAGCGRIGALAGDGTEQVGRFWQAALDWPMVWDQDEETAIQAPRGGSKFTWGGPPVMPKPEENRLRLELGTGDPVALAARLRDLGAADDPRFTDLGWIAMLDVDGNEFRIRAAESTE